MDEITMNAAQMMTSYGALGGVCVWLMYMHTTLFKKVSDTLSEVNATLKLMREEEG